MLQLRQYIDFLNLYESLCHYIDLKKIMCVGYIIYEFHFRIVRGAL